jgi:hypothetical protein
MQFKETLVMEGLLFFAGSFFIEGGLALLLMLVMTEPARARSDQPGEPTDLAAVSGRKAA